MPSIDIGPNMAVEFAIKKMKRLSEKAGILKSKEFYEKPTSLRRRKAMAGRKRAVKKVYKSMEVSAKTRRKW